MNHQTASGEPTATPPTPEVPGDAGAATAGVQPDSPPADGTADSSPASDVPAADSSPADGVSREDLLNVTRNALAIPPAPGTGSPAPTGQDAGQSAPDPNPTLPASAEGEAPPAEGDDSFEDADKLPFGKHPRFRRLLDQVKRDREPAAQYRQVNAFLTEHGVDSQGAANALKLAALLRHAERGSVEHAKLFLEDVMPAVTRLRQLLGEEIAPDLQQRVADGSVDEDTAKELTQSRLRGEAAERERESTESQRAEESRAAFIAEVKQAVSGWDAGVRSRDPDFSRKEKLVQATIQRITAVDGPPKSAKDAVALAQRAYDEVNEAFRGLVSAPPPPPPPAPPRIGNALPRSGARPQPRTPEEITRMALAGGASS